MQHLPEILGRELTKQGRIGEPNAEARAIQTFAADAYHGGRNEAFVHGIFTATPERPFVDYDLKGCYTTAMAPFRTLDWASIEHTKELARLAVLEDPTVARSTSNSPKACDFPACRSTLATGVWSTRSRAVPRRPARNCCWPSNSAPASSSTLARACLGKSPTWIAPNAPSATSPSS